MKQWMLAVAALALALVALAQNNQTAQTDTAMKSANYIEYSAQTYEAAVEQKRVLFFAASWCPSCRAADKDINAKLGEIPKDLVILKTDYDKETALKTKYGIIRQHTFVWVNAKGEAIKKWSGGNLAEIIANTKSVN
jgi:thiol-disulfide isomerase/thioredoxin